MIAITQGNILEQSWKIPTILMHGCNDVGAFGSGIAGQIAKKYPHVQEDYFTWANDAIAQQIPFKLGQIKLVKAEDNLVICNAITQRDCGIQNIDGEALIPFKHESFRECLLRLRSKIKSNNTTNVQVVAPLIGAGLAGSSIDKIYPVVHEVFNSSDIKFTLFAFNTADFVELANVHNQY